MSKKIGIFLVIFLLFATALFVFAQTSSQQICWQTPIICDFENAAATGQWEIGNTSPNFDKEFSGIKAITGGPAGLAVAPDMKKSCLGVKTAFKSRGYNYIEVLPPVYKEELYPNLKNLFSATIPNPKNEKFIPLPGKIQSINVWVAGRKFRYTAEVWIQDYNGFVYALEMGKLDYPGWRVLSRELPTYVPQEDKYWPAERPLKFIKFVLRADPDERADKFYVYFDQLGVFTDLYIKPIDGTDIVDTW